MVRPPRITTRTINHSLLLLSASLETDYVWMALVVRSGAAADPAGQGGLAHLTEHLNVADAREFPVHGLWQHLRANGGGLNAQTCVDATTFLVWVPADEWQQALAALAAIVLCDPPSESVLESERRVVLDELPLTRLPGSSAEMAACYFGSHPYGQPVEGTRASARSLTAAAIDRFRRRHYVCRNSALIVVGPCDVDSLCQSAGTLFAAMLPGQPTVVPPRFQRSARGQIIRSLRVPRKGGQLSLWLPMTDAPSALLMAHVLRTPGGPLQQMLIDQGFPSLSGTADVWLARAAQTLIVQVQADGPPTLGRHELLDCLRNLAREVPDPQIIQAAQRQLLMHYAENMQNSRWLCEELADCVARGEEWTVREAAISDVASSLQQRWTSLLNLSGGLINCTWPALARGHSLAWPEVCPRHNVISSDKNAIVGAGDLISAETTPSAPRRLKMANGATLLVHRSRATRFTLTAGFINGEDALPAALAASGGEGWNRLVRALAIGSLSLRGDCAPDHAWLQMTGPTEQFGVALEYLLRIVDTPPNCRFARIAEAWAERQRRLAGNNLSQSLPLRLMAEIFPAHHYGRPYQAITWERMLHCWNESFVGCRSVWVITGDIADRDVTSLAKAIETLRSGEVLHGDHAIRAERRTKLVWVDAPVSAVSITWALPPEGNNTGDLEALRWLLSGSLFRAMRAGDSGIYRGGVLYQSWRDGGMFGLYVIARPWRAGTCLRKMRLAMAQAHADRFDAQSVAAAKSALCVAEDELCANQDAWGLELVGREVSGYSAELAAVRYQEVSLSTVQCALQQHLGLEQAVTLVLWPSWRTILKALKAKTESHIWKGLDHVNGT